MAKKIQVAVIAAAFLGSVALVVVIALSLVNRWADDQEADDIQLAAELLCPNAPEDVKGALFFDRDSDDVAFIGVSGTDETVSFYIIASETDSGERVLDPQGEAALAFMQSMSLSCFAVEPTPPPPTEAP